MNTARNSLALDPHRSEQRIYRTVYGVGYALIFGVLVLVGYGLYSVAHRETVDEAYVRGIVTDCYADGYTPHVHRDAHGKILGASCAREARP
jgi:hypothetical protein